MTDYIPPLKDMLFNIHELSGLDRVLGLPCFVDFDKEVIDQVVEEAGKFAAEVLSPLNIPADQTGCKLVDKEVVAVPGFAEAHGQFVENGWQSLDVAPAYGGMGMPGIVGSAAAESWYSACMSFSLGPLLTAGAIRAIETHGSDDVRSTYLPKMISGAWTGTMNMTEPQAGSDLSVVATRAVPDGDHYRITGSKIFITWGDHDFLENVIHLVLARLPDAPDGVRGISLFAVPKFMVNEDGGIGEPNDVHVAGIEHKLGIHAAPTCVMAFGETDGAVGYLVGEENKGLACMFTMMNHARVGVGLQAVAISERAYQLARSFALDRKQGRAPGVKGSATIIHHPDVRRMLLVMKSQIEAMRAATYYTAGIMDLASQSDDELERIAAADREAVLTPIIKGWQTEVAQELTSLGVQIHGGMGFVEETGAAQHMRDARILPIYEGTTGIQALDFVGRKILADDGKALGEMLDEMSAIDTELAADDHLADIRAALAKGVEQLRAATKWLLEHSAEGPDTAGAASVNLLMLAGVVVGGWQMARAGLAIKNGAASDDAAFCDAKLTTVRFYAQHIMPKSSSFYDAAIAGSASVMDLPEESF
jgi:alkylation response protein AidB-like acyl-CoA dehydrogenase